MSRIKELRASFDKQLDALEHQALALEAQLTQTKDQAMQRLEQQLGLTVNDLGSPLFGLWIKTDRLQDARRKIGDQRSRVGALAQAGERPEQRRAGAAAAMDDNRLRSARQHRGERVDIGARQGRRGDRDRFAFLARHRGRRIR